MLLRQGLQLGIYKLTVSAVCNRMQLRTLVPMLDERKQAAHNLGARRPSRVRSVVPSGKDS